MSFDVQLSPTAEADLERLFDFLLDRAETTEELDRAQAAIDAGTYDRAWVVEALRAKGCEGA